MFIDARKLEDGHKVRAKICIIGAGAAGITLGRQLVAYGHSVCLLESGGLDYDLETQALYRGDNVGTNYDPLEACRLRYFGGTTNHWAGWTRPLDAVDFEQRDWVPNSGWPIKRSDLDSYYQRAETILQLGSHRYDAEYWCDQSCDNKLIDHGAVESRVFRFSPPTRFGQEYRQEVEASKLLQAYLYANVTDIELNAAGNAVQSVKLATLSGHKHNVEADTFILATGGIENARLLLASNAVQKQGIGNQHDLVGRYFSDHVGMLGGTFLLTKANTLIDFYRQHEPEKKNGNQPVSIRGALTLDVDTIRRQRLYNFGCLLSRRRWPGIVKDALTSSSFASHIGTVAGSIDDMLLDGYRSLFAPEERAELFELAVIMESTPNRDSRVSLAEARDALGMNCVKLDWQLHPQDREMIGLIRQQLALELGRANVGRVLLEEEDVWPPPWLEYGRHHMGTTRMHEDPKQGVVDANCRVHDMENLFIAGSSVFPSYGYAQPTFTIVALALRLADHIHEKGLA